MKALLTLILVFVFNYGHTQCWASDLKEELNPDYAIGRRNSVQIFEWINFWVIFR